MKLENIWQEFITLPPIAQREVADFIAFLKQRYQQSQPELQTTLQDWREDPFIGIWKDREDLQDSTHWVRTIRQQEWPN